MQTTTVEVKGERVPAVEIGRHGKLIPVPVIRRAVALHPIRTLDDVKDAGRELKALAMQSDYLLKHSEALEAIAKAMGFASFPAMREQLNGGSHGR